MPKPAFVTKAEAPSLRPKPRPAGLVVQTAAEAAPVVAASFTVPRPPQRPEGLVLASAPKAQPQEKPARQTMKGAVCGRADIKGEALAPMRSTKTGCGIKEPVELTSIGGITLSPRPTVGCAQAVAIANWVEGGLQPAFNNQVVKLTVADSYSCRPRNNVRGNPPSVHGKGEAIDFGAAILASGKSVPISSRLDKRWQKARKAACRYFTVILGPGSDGYHETHLHLDVSQHGGDPHCR